MFIVADTEPPAKKPLFWKIQQRAQSQSDSLSLSTYAIWEQWTHNNSQILPDALKKAYVRYNTTLPSSAPVERLFSLSKRVLSPTRTLLSDKNFEIMVLLGCNKAFAKNK